MTAAQWRDQLLAALPPGKAWPQGPGTVFYELTWGLAEGFARAEARIEDLLIEADPRSTSELLPEWEQRYGLPRCGDLEQTTTERRDTLVATIQDEGNGSPDHLISLAAAVGYVITIDENTPDAFTFTVNAPLDTITSARFGIARYGDPYRKWGNELLQCLINFYKHAHLKHNISFGGP